MFKSRDPLLQLKNNSSTFQIKVIKKKKLFEDVESISKIRSGLMESLTKSTVYNSKKQLNFDHATFSPRLSPRTSFKDSIQT